MSSRIPFEVPRASWYCTASQMIMTERARAAPYTSASTEFPQLVREKATNSPPTTPPTYEITRLSNSRRCSPKKYCTSRTVSR